jgi:hypothetical protein
MIDQGGECRPEIIFLQPVVKLNPNLLRIETTTAARLFKRANRYSLGII